jgi:phosphoribosylamine--glycine ligase
VRWQPQACATVVMASPGYPGAYPRGIPIEGIDTANALEGVIVFHAGTKQNGGTVSNGGRVLAVSAVAPDLTTALRRAYDGVETIQFAGAHYRRDIGQTVPLPGA